MVELPLAIRTAKAGEEVAWSFAFSVGSVEDVADGGACGGAHIRLACLGAAAFDFAQLSVEVD